MKSKLTVLGLCFFMMNVQSAFAQAQPAGAAVTTGSAMAAVGKAVQTHCGGTVARPVTRSGETSSCPSKAFPLLRAPVGDICVGGRLNRCRAWTRRTRGHGIRRGLRAGTVRPGRQRPMSSPALVGGLPVSERLETSERRARREAAGDGLDLRRRVRVRLECPSPEHIRGRSSPNKASSWSLPITASGVSDSSPFPRLSQRAS